MSQPVSVDVPHNLGAAEAGLRQSGAVLLEDRTKG